MSNATSPPTSWCDVARSRPAPAAAAPRVDAPRVASSEKDVGHADVPSGRAASPSSVMRFDAAPVEDAPAPPALALPDPPRALTARRVAPAAVELAWRRGDASQSARGLDRVESRRSASDALRHHPLRARDDPRGRRERRVRARLRRKRPRRAPRGRSRGRAMRLRVRETSVAGAGPWSPEVVETVENAHPPEKTETRRRDDPSTGSSGKRSDVQPPETVRRSDPNLPTRRRRRYIRRRPPDRPFAPTRV